MTEETEQKKEQEDVTQVIRRPRPPATNNWWRTAAFLIATVMLVALLVRVNEMSGDVAALRKDMSALKADNNAAVTRNAVTTHDGEGDLVTAMDVLLDIHDQMGKVAKKGDLEGLAKTRDLSGLARKKDLSRMASASKSRLRQVEEELNRRLAAEKAKETAPAATSSAPPAPAKKSASLDEGTIRVIVRPVPINE